MINLFPKGKSEHLYTKEAADLMEKMLTYDKRDRITALEALNHDYFKECRYKLPEVKFE